MPSNTTPVMGSIPRSARLPARRTASRVPTLFLWGWILINSMLLPVVGAPGAGHAVAPSEPTHTDVFRAGEDGYHTYRIPSVVLTQKSTLLAFAEGRKESRRDQGPTDMVLKRSVDGGQTWLPMQVVVQAVPHAAMNPCPVVDHTGVIWLVYDRWPQGFHGKVTPGLGPDAVSRWVTSSADDGVTWAPPVNITASTKKPHWTGMAHGPGVGIRTRSNRLVIPTNQHAEGFTCMILYSDDHGGTWQLGGAAGPAVGESQVVELADGSYMLNMRSYRGQNRRAIATSNDGGMTWSPIRDDPTLIEPGRCQASFLRYTLATEHGKNRLLFSNPASEAGRVNGTVRLSYDEGQTWPVAKTIVPGSFAYSCLTVLPDMTIGCLYETDTYTRIRFAHFTLEWLTDGSDRIERK